MDDVQRSKTCGAWRMLQHDMDDVQRPKTSRIAPWVLCIAARPAALGMHCLTQKTALLTDMELGSRGFLVLV